jgi:hypothetical protein
MSTKADAIKNTLTAMLSGLSDDDNELYKAASADPVVQEAAQMARDHKIDQFYLTLQYPVENLVRGLLAAEMPGNADAHFLMAHSQFVEGHLKTLIKKYEGWSCCADKSRTMMQALLKYFLTDTPIVFDYTQKFTYHLPEKVLNTHESLTEFFKGLKFLYYGNPEHYLTALAKLMAELANEPPPKF